MNLSFRKSRPKPVALDAGLIDDDLLVQLLVDDFFCRREQGSKQPAAEYVKQFHPSIQAALLRDLDFEEALLDLEQNSLLGGSSNGSGLSDWSQTEDDTRWPVVGGAIGGFELTELIGRGKFSRVFSARSGSVGPDVAIKVCRSQGKHEARTLAKVLHSAIGVVDDVEEIPNAGLTAIYMPLKSRTTLGNVLRSVDKNGAIPESAGIVWDEVQLRNKLLTSPPAWAGKSYVAWAHSLMSTLAEALSAAHGQSTAHCDIKPQNVLVTAEGTPILIDFNLSLRWDVETSSPNIGGTLPYMAPEQIRAFESRQRGDIGPRTDIYGLAATIYQLLTGELPFQVPDERSVRKVLKLRKRRPRSIRKLNPTVPRALAAVITDCLSYDPEGRPRTAADLVARLNHVATAPEEHTSQRRFSAGTLIGAATVAAAALVFAIIYPPGTSSELPLLAVSTPHDETESIVQPVLTAEQQDQEILQILSVGYDAYEEQNFEFAKETFNAVVKLDPEHDGANIGRARAMYQLGEYEEASKLLLKHVPDSGLPETDAVIGFCYAIDANNRLAIPWMRDAVDKGLATRESLTNLAWCLKQTSEAEEAIELLKRVRAMPGDTSSATLILVQSYAKVWRRRVKGKEVHKFDTDRLASLIDECPEGPARGLTAAITFAGCAGRYAPAPPTNKTGFARQNPELYDYWRKRSHDEFMRGCELGLDPRYWWGVQHKYPESYPKPDGVGERSEAIGLRQHRRFYLLDPLVITPLARCMERDLEANQRYASKS